MTGLITPIEDNHFRYIYQRKSIHYPYTATKKGPSPVDSLDPEGAWRGGQRGIDARDVGIGRGGVNKSLLCQCSPTSAPVYGFWTCVHNICKYATNVDEHSWYALY